MTYPFEMTMVELGCKEILIREQVDQGSIGSARITWPLITGYFIVHLSGFTSAALGRRGPLLFPAHVYRAPRLYRITCYGIKTNVWKL